MSTGQNVIEIARQSVILTGELSTEGHTISGIAIGEGDVTRGQSGIKKVWPREALKPAASSLEDRPLVVDHDNSSHSTVGKVTKTQYKEGVGVLYEAELYDDQLAQKIRNGLLEVSIRGHHGDVSEMSENEEGAKVVESLVFDNLSIVPRGAAPSNTVEIGPSNEITAAECAEMLNRPEGAEEDVDDPDENAEEQPERAAEELAGTVHKPSFSSTTESEWSKPSLEDFTDDSWEDLSAEEQSDIGDHFIFSVNGFPADSYGDMKLPVVEPDGALNLNALQNAKSRLSQTEGLSDDQRDDVRSMVNTLASENYDVDWGDEENKESDEAAEAADSDPEDDVDEELTDSTSTDESENTSSEEAGTGGTPAPSATTETGNTKMTDEETEDNTVSISEDELSELRQAQEELDELRQESESRSEQLASLREDMEEDFEELKERTQILDEVSREKVEELREYDDAVVMSHDEYATLEEQVDSVRNIYSERLAEELEILDAEEVRDKFSVEEMADKLEEILGEEYEEELSPNPRSQNVEEEEEQTSETEEAEEEEEVKQKQAELRDKILG